MRATDKVIASILNAITLNPETVPETEMLAESFIVRNYINSDYVRVSLGEDDSFRVDEKSECVNVILQTGDPGNTLRFTYYGGDNIPAGPRHGLMVTNISTDTLLYWRTPRQDPATKWRYNLFAQAQAKFKFNPQGSDPRFMTQECLYEVLRETLIENANIGYTEHSTVTEYLCIKETSSLLVEVAYLNFWNYNNQNAPAEEGISFKADCDYIDSIAITVTVTCDNRNDIEPVSFQYTVDPEEEDSHPNYYKLRIIDGENLVYERGLDQNEATTWHINSMANNRIIMDKCGGALFVGAPIKDESDSI